MSTLQNHLVAFTVDSVFGKCWLEAVNRKLSMGNTWPRKEDKKRGRSIGEGLSAANLSRKW